MNSHTKRKSCVYLARRQYARKSLSLVMAFLISCLMLSACSTIVVHSDDTITPAPYIGTKRAIKQTARHWQKYDYYGQVFVYALDVPLCLIADTVLLPYDWYKTLDQ